MTKTKYTRSRIWRILQSGTGIGPAQAMELTGKIIDSMAAALASGETVELRGLGTLEPRERKARAMRNPRTLALVQVPSRRRVIFRPGQKLKAALRNGQLVTHE